VKLNLGLARSADTRAVRVKLNHSRHDSGLGLRVEGKPWVGQIGRYSPLEWFRFEG
jgi:hypothetical protein